MHNSTYSQANNAASKGVEVEDARIDPVLKVTESTPQQILEHRENVLSEDPERQLLSTQHFRRLLSIGE